jgi:hypothetical protein
MAQNKRAASEVDKRVKKAVIRIEALIQVFEHFKA